MAPVRSARLVLPRLPGPRRARRESKGASALGALEPAFSLDALWPIALGRRPFRHACLLVAFLRARNDDVFGHDALAQERESIGTGGARRERERHAVLDPRRHLGIGDRCTPAVLDESEDRHRILVAIIGTFTGARHGVQ